MKRDPTARAGGGGRPGAAGGLWLVGVALWLALHPAPVRVRTDPGDVLETALALPGTLAMARLDLAALRGAGVTPVESGGDEGAAPSPAAALWRAGMATGAGRARIDTWSAAWVAGPAGVDRVEVFGGRLPVARLREILARDFDLTFDGSLRVLEGRDPESCARLPPTAVWIEPERAVVGPPELVTAVRRRLGRAPAGIGLAGWRAFRADRPVSAVLLPPEEVGSVSWLRPGERDAPSLPGVFTGAFVAARPRDGAALAIDAQVWGPSGVEPAELRETWRAWSLRPPPGLPGLRHWPVFLLEAGTVASRGAQAIGSRSADLRELRAWLARLAGGDAQPALAPAGSAGGLVGTPADPRWPPLLRAQVAPDELMAPGEIPGLLDAGGVAAGPFAVRLGARRVLVDQRDRYELEIEAESVPIPNLAGALGPPRALLHVTEVRSRDGREWLAEERCGHDRNDRAAALHPTGGRPWRGDGPPAALPRFAASKRVRLAPEARLEAIERIAGHVELRLPTRLEHHSLPLGAEPGSVAGHALAVGRHPLQPRAVVWTPGPRSDRVLALRARDADGALLAARGVERTWAEDGSLRLVHRFGGIPAVVELWIVAEERVSRSAFAIDDWRPHFRAFATSAGPPVSTGDRQSFDRRAAAASPSARCGPGARSEARLGAFALCLLETGVADGRLTTRLELVAPDLEGVGADLSSLELRLERVDLAQGGGGTVSLPARARDFPRPERSSGGALPRDTVELSAAVGGGSGAVVRSLRGRLVHRLPLRLQPLRLDLGRLGNAVEYSNGFAMQWVEQRGQRLGVLLEGERDRFVQLLVRDAEGGEVPLRDLQLRPLAGGSEDRPRWWLEFEVAAAPVSLELVYALAVDRFELPFILAREPDAPSPLASLAR